MRFRIFSQTPFPEAPVNAYPRAKNTARGGAISAKSAAARALFQSLNFGFLDFGA